VSTADVLLRSYRAYKRAVFAQGEVAYALGGKDDVDGKYADACNEARIARQYYDDALTAAIATGDA
jgi:hypothetical protein